ncbi:hypothetical protein FVR03_09270 [Pontibacter qinzhouensis]|uniref:Uncharacterized protein n=1 Tax=Pontibacter qinzhouensis TaxID=2603253 RepID=A0A5C8KA54_9BACT|nr:hypothetical protein [Pontibacter qinzhouensis]TXK47572.1 hypothetical protein FVR03_09270 [Pontibacter qinzhouensis]
MGRQQYNVRIDAEFKSVEEIKQIVIRNTRQGGLTFSTLITLVFVPVMYAIFHLKRKHKVSLLSG